MSIASAISNAQAKIAAAYAALRSKGATMPATQDLANMPSAIESVPDKDELLIEIKGKKLTSVTLPSVADGMSAAYGLDGLFCYYSALKYVTIPTDFTRIGFYAFAYCGGLLRLNSSTDGVVTLWEGLTECGNYSFYQCSKITSVNIPSTMVTLQGYNFYGCTKLASVDFSLASSLSTIGAYAFRGCTALTSVDMSGMTSLTAWNTNLFYGCTGLTSAILPPNLTATNTGLFYGCTKLASITIPDTVATITANTFYNCTLLYEINFGNTRTTIPSLANVSAFYTNNSTTISSRKIIVPDALYDSWIAATNWKSTTYGIKNQIIRYSDYYV